MTDQLSLADRRRQAEDQIIADLGIKREEISWEFGDGFPRFKGNKFFRDGTLIQGFGSVK